MTVYVDVVIGINFLLNFLMLLCVKWISGAKTRELGVVLAALLGGVYSVFMFDSRFEGFYSPFIKPVVAALMIIICFKSEKNFIKLVFYFYITAFAFAGAASYVSNLSGVTTVKNGMVYTENSIWVIIAACVAAYFVIRYVLKHMRMNVKRYGEKTEVVISVAGKTASVTGMMDTGNSLLDPISLYPVVVVEYDSIKDILPSELNEFLKEGSDISCNISRRYLEKIRLIPYSTVRSGDILKGFCPDYIKVKESGKEISEVVVAVIYEKLSGNNEFDAILNPLM